MTTATAPVETPVPPARIGVASSVVVIAVAGTFVIAFLAFWLSFTALSDLAALAGVPAGLEWIWPLIVDGVILEATISVVALREAPAAARRYAWLLLVCGAAVSVAANITHAVVAADARVPAIVAALVASVPPLVLLAMTHLSVVLARHRAPAPAPAPPIKEQTRSARPRIIPGAEGRARALTVGRDEARREALTLAASGAQPTEIARRLGVHRTTVARWLEADVPDDDGRSSP